ncbi:hypothetical protein MUN81_13535 [Hymenobacter sp. 5317J-9]|uniref:hypothetical protein n=1 Tax=Hymenobacter sp. 5317J-9 TaxID=2932250 RepID=UPI001FD6A85F|nr:hypothetical protein [Hymenobacter sp. 5317J-9]UOQ96270.1 hypothetical protein MUN81_13535 [Hymenobacter sp. 5317J-9]
MPTRRTFLAQSGAALTGALLLPVLPGCAPANPLAHIKGRMLGQDAATGHLLRDPGRIPAPTQTIQTDVLIIGGAWRGFRPGAGCTAMASATRCW